MVHDFGWDSIALRHLHSVRRAAELGANKFLDVTERAGYFYDKVAIAGSGLVPIGIEVD